MIKYCVFDLDGTLLNTIDSIAYYVNKTLQNHKIKPITIDETKRFVGNGAEALIRRCLESRGAYHSEELLHAVHTEYKSQYDTEPLYLTTPYDGISELLVQLRAHGIKLAVLSNKPESAVVPIVESFFPGAFDLVLGAKAGYPLKPDPTRLFDIIKSFSASPSEVAYFGDTATDIETGLAAGVAVTVGVLWGFRDRAELSGAGADAIVSHPSEITGIIS